MSLHLVQIIIKFAFFVLVCNIRHQNGRFPLCRRQQKYFLSDVQDLLLNQEMLHCRCCPLPTTHPKLELATGMSAWQRPLAVQHHMKIHDDIFHPSYVAQ